MARDYYSDLDIKYGASVNEIKKAFKTLSKIYHPDVTGGDQEKFKIINTAYQILSNPAKKKEYDFNNFGSGFSKGFDDNKFSYENVGRKYSWSDSVQDLDINVNIHISIQDAIYGCKKTVVINNAQSCDITIEPGIGNGEIITKRSEGYIGYSHSVRVRGDLFIKVIIDEDKYISIRDNSNIIDILLLVNCFDMVFGCSLVFDIYGLSFIVDIKEGTLNGSEIVLGKVGGLNYDIHAHCIAEIPSISSLNDNDKLTLKTIINKIKK